MCLWEVCCRIMVERAYLDPELHGEPSDTKGFLQESFATHGLLTSSKLAVVVVFVFFCLRRRGWS